MSEVELAEREPGDVADSKSASVDESEASTDKGPAPEVVPPTAARRPLPPPAVLGIDTSAMLAMSEAVKNLQVNLIPAVRVPIPDVSRFVMSLPALEALRRPLVDPNANVSATAGTFGRVVPGSSAVAGLRSPPVHSAHSWATFGLAEDDFV